MHMLPESLLNFTALINPENRHRQLKCCCFLSFTLRKIHFEQFDSSRAAINHFQLNFPASSYFFFPVIFEGWRRKADDGGNLNMLITTLQRWRGEIILSHGIFFRWTILLDCSSTSLPQRTSWKWVSGRFVPNYLSSISSRSDRVSIYASITRKISQKSLRHLIFFHRYKPPIYFLTSGLCAGLINKRHDSLVFM